MSSFTLIDIVSNLLTATRWTIVLSLIAFVGGGVVGLVIMLMRISSFKPVCLLSQLYIGFFQGTPLLMQLFLVFFGISIVTNINLSPWMSATLALTAFTSAFLADIWRGSIESIPKGQWEASASVGLTYWKQLFLVILPQATRVSLPPTVGFLVQVIKGTSLASVIGFIELTRSAQSISNVTFQPLLVYSFAALIYFGLCFPLSWWSRRMEQQLSLRG